MRKKRPYPLCLLLEVILLLLVGTIFSANRAYDPLAIDAKQKIETLDLTVSDAARQREIPLRVYLPAEKSRAPVLLFSHGLGGSREGNAYLGEHWAKRGYLALFLQHVGSDTSIWQRRSTESGAPPLLEAMGFKNFLLRVGDVTAVLDQLEQWNILTGHPLAGRLDLKRIGMSGHSYGAITTQAVSGQAFPEVGQEYTDKRIKAAIMFSPSSPHRGGDPYQQFKNVKIPWLLVTGTRDFSPFTLKQDTAIRLAVYPALPPWGKYELVLFNAEHSAFTDRALPGDREPRNPNHHRAILAVSTAFWDAWLRGDPRARTWLDGSGPSTVLEKEDRWQKK